MAQWLDRTKILIGDEAVQTLAKSRVAVLGLGGVGSAAAEGICRSGIGQMLIVDCDEVDITNINRQLIAVHSNIGQRKCEAAKTRLLDINPSLDITIHDEMLTGENLAFLAEWQPDFVIDAIDNVTAKLGVAKLCCEKNISLIMCLGTGNRLKPEMLQIGDISQTAGSGCPLARILRKELKKRGILSQKVLFSTEEAIKPDVQLAQTLHQNGRHSPASMAFVPPVAGFMLASHAVLEILQKK